MAEKISVSEWQKRYGKPAEAGPSTSMFMGTPGGERIVPQIEDAVLAEQAMDKGTAEAGEAVMRNAPYIALGAAGAGSSLASRAIGAATSPAGLAAIKGGAEALKGRGAADIALAAGEGALEGYGLKGAGKLLSFRSAPAAVRAVLGHALARLGPRIAQGAELGSEAVVAAKVAPTVAKAATEGVAAASSAPLRHAAGAAASKEAMEAAGDQVLAKIQTLIRGKLSDGQIVSALGQLYGLPPSTAKAMLKMVK